MANNDPILRTFLEPPIYFLSRFTERVRLEFSELKARDGISYLRSNDVFPLRETCLEGPMYITAPIIPLATVFFNIPFDKELLLPPCPAASTMLCLPITSAPQTSIHLPIKRERLVKIY